MSVCLGAMPAVAAPSKTLSRSKIPKALRFMLMAETIYRLQSEKSGYVVMTQQ